MLLARARGLEPIRVALPARLHCLSDKAFVEMRLVWDQASRHYTWHLVVEDGKVPAPSPGTEIAGVDLGEIHPATASDGSESIVFSARELRSLSQQTQKRLAEIQALQSKKSQAHSAGCGCRSARTASWLNKNGASGTSNIRFPGRSWIGLLNARLAHSPSEPCAI